jgi:glycosyltransferase involved in cell wall biosynthesis
MSKLPVDQGRMPLVDVVVPVYNGELHLPETLKTINRQDYPNLHVYIVDDCSSDGTNQIAQNFDCRYPISIIRHPANRGLSAARNTGISSGIGEFIAILDADDLWANNKISKQIAVFFEANSTVGVVSSNFHIIDEYGVMTHPVIYDDCMDVTPSTRHLLVPGNVVSGGSAALIRRECFQRCGGFDETLTACEDWEMWYRIACYYSILIVREPLVLVRRHAESMQGNTPRMLRNRIQVFQRFVADSRYSRLAGQLLKEECVACFRYLSPPIGQSFNSAYDELMSLGIADNSVSLDLWSSAYKHYHAMLLLFTIWKQVDDRIKLRSRLSRYPFIRRLYRALRWRIQIVIAVFAKKC